MLGACMASDYLFQTDKESRRMGDLGAQRPEYIEPNKRKVYTYIIIEKGRKI